jgi:hypothetical protein
VTKPSAKHFPQSLDGRVESLIEIAEGFVWPEYATEVVAADERSVLAHEHHQHAKELLGQDRAAAVLPDFTRPRIELDAFEPEPVAVPIGSQGHAAPIFIQFSARLHPPAIEV